jgi:hypothetical protein
VSRTKLAVPVPAVAPESIIFQHRTQSGWGAACIAWEREGKRGFQFEDGHIRVFNAAYGHLMEAIDVSRERADSLLALAGRAAAPPAAAVAAGVREPITLDQQLAYLRTSYPDGFAGEAWTREHRTHPTRNAKRHRDPAIVRARVQLAQSTIEGWITSGRALHGVATLRDLLDSTDLVGPAAIKLLAGGDPFTATRMVAALRDLLWSELPIGRRFEQWVTALTSGGRAASWALATAPLALVHPDQQVCVNQASFQAQAAWLAPELQLGSLPQAPVYERALRMAVGIRELAGERGMPPADLLDIHDFIALTLGGRARAQIAPA